MNKIYINSIKQISAQQPLSDDWFENPVFYSEPYIRAIDPDFKSFLSPNTARRLGKILKRALVVSQKTMEESGVSNPDAIITGTGLGCIENTELFLDKLVREGEELLNPTQFMQSTHNTISSLIAIEAKCHSYNTTYAHKGISFECALQDAFLQLSRTNPKKIDPTTALTGAYDEMTPTYFNLLKKAGYLGKPQQVFAGETAVAMMLATEKTEKTLCEIEAVEKVYSGVKGVKELEGVMKFEGINRLIDNREVDYIMVGINGDPKTDEIYYENCAALFPGVPLLHYKHIFGESYTAPALGVYAAALCLQKGKIPNFLMYEKQNAENIDSLKPYFLEETLVVNRILCYHHFEGKNHSFILLSKF